MQQLGPHISIYFMPTRDNICICSLCVVPMFEHQFKLHTKRILRGITHSFFNPLCEQLLIDFQLETGHLKASALSLQKNSCFVAQVSWKHPILNIYFYTIVLIVNYSAVEISTFGILQKAAYWTHSSAVNALLNFTNILNADRFKNTLRLGS